MSGPPAQQSRRRRAAPTRGEWTPTAGVGWQHGAIPDPPGGVSSTAREAWDTWMRSWFAARWAPEDLPVLRMIVRLYSKVMGGKASASERAELRQMLDNYGITPKGQQDRRWQAPAKPTGDGKPATKAAPASPYSHLRVVNE